MLDWMPVPLPWYLVGPLMGLTVAGLYAITNKHLGVSGAYVQAVDFARGRPIERWRLWLLGGTFLGAAAVALVAGSPQAGWGYGALGEYLSFPALVATLFVGSVLIGFGARWAGACTSGHGLTGCSTRSRGSFVAVVTFMVTAVAVTFLLHAVTGGAL
ncbi:MAG: YeeE/YedE family protein [Chloroflexia bacterium]|nr:YeeE/YedE family protein [Chloroflexia bacterium]